MKILHVIPNLAKGGAEKITLDIVRYINKHTKHDIKLISLGPNCDFDIKDIKHCIHFVKADVKVRFFKKRLLEIDNLQNVINNYLPDVIHTHLFKADLVTHHCSYPKAKWFSHYHGFIPEFNDLGNFKRRLTKRYERFILKRLYKKNKLCACICVSSAIKIYIGNHIKNKLEVLNNAIYVESYKKKYRLNDKKYRFLTVGRLTENKNQIFLIKIIEKLLIYNPNIKLDIIGDGILKKKLKNYIDSANLNNNIQVLNNQSNLEAIYCKYDIYLHSAKLEAFGLTQLEAMSAGLPVVAFNAKGNIDLIENNSSGIIINELNPSIFINKINDLIYSNNLYRKISKNAIECAQNFNMNFYIDDLITLYGKY